LQKERLSRGEKEVLEGGQAAFTLKLGRQERKGGIKTQEGEWCLKPDQERSWKQIGGEIGSGKQRKARKSAKNNQSVGKRKRKKSKYHYVAAVRGRCGGTRGKGEIQ